MAWPGHACIIRAGPADTRPAGREGMIVRADLFRAARAWRQRWTMGAFPLEGARLVLALWL
jgi:hypothetical protein